MKRTTLSVGTVLLFATGCDFHDLGVRSVEFSLAATPVSSPPATIDGTTLASIGLSGGSVHANVIGDDGEVTVTGLPDLPAGHSYLAMLQFAEDARADIPGGDEGETGHSHGALTTGPDVLYSAELTAVAVGTLTGSDGAWSLAFDSAALDPQEMGALRSGMIMLVPDIGSPVMVLFGEVEEDAEAGGEGGHDHGV